MTENRIASTAPSGYRRVGLQGQPVIGHFSQIVQILRNRLGREHAELLARPNADPYSGAIEWSTSRQGTPHNLVDLDSASRERMASLAEQLLREIGQLADKLGREGASAELVGKMLESALQRPPGDWLYEVDGKPVLIMWGHAAGVDTAPDPVGRSLPSDLEGTALSAASIDASAQGSATLTPMTPVRRTPPYWWLWLLTALLLWLLVLHSCTDMGARLGIRSTPSMDPSFDPSAPAIRRALDEQRALLGELRSLRDRQMPDREGLACVRVEPDAPLSLNDPGWRRPPAVPGPEAISDGKSGSGQDPGRDAGHGRNVDPERDAGLPHDAETDPDAGPAPQARTSPGIDAGRPGPDTGPPSSPRAGTTPDPDHPLTLPKDPAKPGDLAFLKGGWSAGPGLSSTQGDPIDLTMSFDQAGRGRVAIRRSNDGSTCTGPIDAQLRDGRLNVEGSGPLNCDRGAPFAMPRFSCQRDSQGRTQCEGINRDGSTYDMDIFRSRP